MSERVKALIIIITIIIVITQNTYVPLTFPYQ